MSEPSTSRAETSGADLVFPAGFRWGAATAAFQIEGSTRADGRTDSIWDAFCRIPGAVAGGDTGEPAADHYRRMADDVALMAELGLGVYRFSVAWPRVCPDGDSRVNPAGLDFYSRLVDELLSAGITPWITLYHWDLPQVLEDAGGWTSRVTAQRFADYASATAAGLGDRVRFWTTLNEPWCSAFLGYASGEHAPGRTDPVAAVAAAHHLMLAHGLGVEALRAALPDATVGVTLNFAPISPADPGSAADVEAARRIDGLQNRLFLGAVAHGAYPVDVAADLDRYGLADHVLDGDLAVIGTPIDLLGVNYYRDAVVTAGDAERLPSPWVGAAEVRFVERDVPRTGQGWEVTPDGLHRLLTELHREVPHLPLYVTENGAAYPDAVTPDGRVPDVERTRYLDAHVRACHRALADGVDLRGYFAWSLLDNFEWAYGYAQRFGIVHVDYETQVRTVKDSARWFAELVRTGRLPGSS
ncbi:MAG TPA: GH1 family beta-glucosidase [Jiangellaceae bacterium]|nr:GH1 family beta-glucosidase [Jiangellaceae bacterium]